MDFLVLDQRLDQSEEVFVVRLDQLLQVRHVRDLLFDLLAKLLIIKHERQSCKAYQPRPLDLGYLRLFGAPETEYHRKRKQEKLAMHIVLTKFLHLCIN